MLKIIIFITLFSSPALAYIDPATGSIIISFLVGAFSASFFYFKNFWVKIKNIFSQKKEINQKKP